MRRILVWVPVVFILFLVQSYFWVPTYEEQTRGNPSRLREYIEANIGDAQILNPILSADEPSSLIEAKVFEGLLDLDETLNYRGRLATGWRISEEAFFYVNDEAPVAGNGRLDAHGTARRVMEAVHNPGGFPGPVSRTLSRIEEVSVLPSETFHKEIKEKGADGKDVSVTVRISAPQRIRMVLKEVDQDLFSHLAAVLGDSYFTSFDGSRFIVAEPSAFGQKAKIYANEFLPATEHNPVILFHLRPGVKFHDGHLLDAEDVKFTYEAIMNPRNLSPRVADFEPVKSLEIVDPLTVRIVYKRLFSPALGTWLMGILPSHLMNGEAMRSEALARGLDSEGFTLRQSRRNRNPVGCGPFQFDEWQSAQYIRLLRFEDYWEGPPNYHSYIYRVIPDPLTQEMEFYAGTIDRYDVMPHQVERLLKDPMYQGFSVLRFAYAYIGYNMRREPFDDVRVRTALGLAIDVDGIIRYVLYHQGERITGPFIKQTDYYNRKVEPLVHDPEKALSLLAEAGWKRGLDGWLQKDGKRLQFTLITNQGNDTRKAILSIAQNSWRQIGIDVRTDVLEWAVFIQERVNKLDFDAVVLGWTMGIDPDLYQILHSSQTHPNQLNFVGFENAEADDLIVRIRQEYDHDRQVEMCRRLHEVIAREHPYTYLYAAKRTIVLDRRIVIQTRDERGNIVYEKIKPTRTGEYTFYFNKWVKLAEAPQFTME